MMQNLSVPPSSRRQVKTALRNLRSSNSYYMEDLETWADMKYYGRKLDIRSERNASAYSGDDLLESDYAVLRRSMLNSSFGIWRFVIKKLRSAKIWTPGK